VAAAVQGDQGALANLLESHQQRIYNVCLRMVSNPDDAAEVAQDVMLKVIQHISDFKGQSRISTWMIRIAMNLSISHLRKRKVRSTIGLEVGRDDQSTALRQQLVDTREPGPQSNVQKRDLIEHLHAALGQIAPEFRSVLVLRDIEQLDYAQVAGVLSIPVGTVKSRLFRARLALRQVMAKLDEAAAET